jgi:hypothetical protein
MKKLSRFRVPQRWGRLQDKWVLDSNRLIAIGRRTYSSQHSWRGEGPSKVGMVVEILYANSDKLGHR